MNRAARILARKLAAALREEQAAEELATLRRSGAALN